MIGVFAAALDGMVSEERSDNRFYRPVLTFYRNQHVLIFEFLHTSPYYYALQLDSVVDFSFNVALFTSS